MKLIEIKNNFAKLYYRPKDVKIYIADFLTINDGNQKIISQVISIESTSEEDTNCAVLKFTLNLSEKNEISSYNGYVPSLNAEVSKTNPVVLKNFFGKGDNNFRIGEFTINKQLDLYLNKKFFENFAYIQSDRLENTRKLVKHLADSINASLIIDADGSLDINAPMEFYLCENFKLPINFDTLNFIYENDLNGLTVEQKAVVQDIVLDIQEYLKTEESGGYIPFDTLLSVVDEIYKSEKSTGIILFRNKLLRYKQSNLFASNDAEFKALIDAVNNNGAVYLCIKEVSDNWKKETLKFVFESVKQKSNIFLAVEDSYIDKDLIIELKEKHFPVITSKYNLEASNQIKSYAKNMIMFAPNEVQRNYPTYNTFLSKLNPDEYIVSGEETFYTPIIAAPVPFGKPEQEITMEPAPVIPDFSKTKIDSIHMEEGTPVIDESVEENDETLENLENQSGEDDTQKKDISEEEKSENIVEQEENNISSVEDEIAKDVDVMFYSKGKAPVLEENEKDDITVEEVVEAQQQDFSSDEDGMFSDEDLDMLDELNEDEQERETSQTAQESSIIEADNEEMPVIQDELEPESKDDPEEFPYGSESEENLSDDFNSLDLEDAGDIIDLENITEENLQDVPEEIAVVETPVLETKNKVPNIPVYTTEYDEKLRDDETIKIAEGNIVYHQKYGRGVVEQIISYGKKTLCSIQFDNIGRRLLDPNLADLKQV